MLFEIGCLRTGRHTDRADGRLAESYLLSSSPIDSYLNRAVCCMSRPPVPGRSSSGDKSKDNPGWSVSSSPPPLIALSDDVAEARTGIAGKLSQRRRCSDDSPESSETDSEAISLASATGGVLETESS